MRPERLCVACHCMRDKDRLLRVSYTKEDGVSFDSTGKNPGRGAYICRSEDCLQTAMKRNALARSLHCRIPDEVYRELQQALKE